MKDLVKIIVIAVLLFVVLTAYTVDKTMFKTEDAGIYQQTTFENVGVNRVMRIYDTFNSKTGDHDISYQLMSYREFFSLLQG